MHETVTTKQLIDILKSAKITRRISYIHVHHTWSPDHKKHWAKKPDGSYWSRVMERAHRKNGWRTIGQHLTLNPDGTWTIGRDINWDPGSITNRNRAALAIEMFGNFDIGFDTFGGAQAASMFEFVSFILSFLRLSESAIVFHNEHSKKTCPGTSIKKSWFMERVRAGNTRNYSILSMPPSLYTYITELSPVNLLGMKTSFSGRQIQEQATSGTLMINGFISSNYFHTYADGRVKIIGWLISNGVILNERYEQPRWDRPKGTLIVFLDGTVFVGWKTDAQMELIKQKIRFCCQGFNLFPQTKTLRDGIIAEGFNPDEVGRKCTGISIGYNKDNGKIIIAARPSSDYTRSALSMKNLGCEGSAIRLDSGGSANYSTIKNAPFLTDRALASIIYW
jgi:hypothetical protein